MIPLLGAVLVASFLGSLHCLGMCGPLVAAGVAPLGASRREAALAHGLYHSGRLTTLGALGALAGLVGAGIEDAGQLLGLQRLAAVAAGLLLIAWGVASLARSAGGFHLELPFGLGPRVAAALGRVNQLPPRRRALLLGGLTPFLPCGWLYLFALTAAGSGSVPAGALVMLAFGLGNTPILLGLGLGLRGLLGRFRGKLQVASAALLVVVGGLLIVNRSRALPRLPDASALRAAAQAQEGQPTEVDSATRTAPLTTRVPSAANQERLPCCGGAKEQASGE